MRDLNLVKDRVILNCLPELLDTHIEVAYEKLNDAYFTYKRKSNIYHLSVDISLKDAPRDVIEGGMVHDLVHILFEENMNLLGRFFDNLLYLINKRYETRLERKVDLFVLKRGYGKELLKFVQYANNRREEYLPSDGLTQRELIDLLIL